MKHASFRVVVTCLAVAVVWVPAAAERSWIEVKAPHFTVVSNDTERAARDVAWQLEQMRGVIQRLWTWASVDTWKPIVVHAAADETTMKALAPEYWERKNAMKPASVFVEGPDRYRVALRTDAKAQDREGVNPYITAYWSYVALVLNASLDRDLPLWFQRGMADVFSNTIVRDTSIQLGRAIPWHIQRLQRGTRPPIRELFAVDRRSPSYTQADRLELFDAECWALMHFLMFGDEGAHRAQLDRFMALLHEGRPAAAAVEEAFVNVDALQKRFGSYFSQQIYQYTRIEVDLRMKRETFPVRPLPAAEGASQRAALHAAMRRPIEARAAIEEARKADPRLASTYDTEGFLFEVDNKDDAARAAYSKAAELGSTNFRTYYRLGTMTWGQNADAETLTNVKKSLEQSIAINDRFADAFAILGEIRARLKEPDAALTAATRAVQLDARSVRHRLSLARVLWGIQRPDQAETEARTALTIARTEDERRATQELIDFFQNNRRP
jgi:tetratricopeptide (TPR) repeat protein